MAKKQQPENDIDLIAFYKSIGFDRGKYPVPDMSQETTRLFYELGAMMAAHPEVATRHMQNVSETAMTLRDYYAEKRDEADYAISFLVLDDVLCGDWSDELSAQDAAFRDAREKAKVLFDQEHIFHSKLFTALSRLARGRAAQKKPTFANIAQNKAVNALPQAIRTLQPNLLNTEAVARIGKGTGEVAAKLDNTDQYGFLETVDLMLLRCLQGKIAESHDDITRLPLREYAELRGRATTKDVLKELRKEAVQSLNRLANITFTYKEKVNGRWVNNGGVRMNGGTFIIQNGIILWSWNPVFKEQLTRYPPTQYALEGLKTDPRTPAFYFSDKIDQHYRMNEGKPNENVISIAALLHNAPNLQTIDEVRQTRQSPARRIIRPFFKHLDALDRLYYDVLDENGAVINPETITDYDVFIKCKIRFDTQLAGYDAHTDRTEARQKRAKRAAARPSNG